MNEELLTELHNTLNELMKLKPKNEWEFKAINELVHSFVDVICHYERAKPTEVNE